MLQPGSPSAPGQHALPLAFASPKHKSSCKSTANLLEAHGLHRKMKTRNVETSQQLRAWSCVSIPSRQEDGQELEPPRECGLQPPGKRSGSESESEEVAELEAPSAEEAERDPSPGDLPQLPRKGSISGEKWFAEATEEGEEEEHRPRPRRRVGPRRKEWNSCEEASEEGDLQCQGSSAGSSNSERPRRRKARAPKLEGAWDLEELQQQLQQDLDCGECEGQCQGALGSSTLGRRLGGQGLGPSSGRRQAWAGLQGLGGIAQCGGERAGSNSSHRGRSQEASLKGFAGCCPGL